jgi:hypothetical protein
MKDFILDSTYKDATIINSNNDAITIPVSSLPANTTTHHSINLNRISSIHCTNHNRDSKFNPYNLIDYL